MTVTDPGWLIAMRGLLGVGAALVMPATLSTITSTFPREQRARAVGAWAGVAGASAILGLLASGALLEVWSWRAVFGLNVALAVAAIVGTLRVIPETADPAAPKLDLVGALITVAGLGVLVYSIIEAPTAGWSSAGTLLGLATGLVLIGAFVVWELRHPAPLLDPRLFRHRAFAAGTVSITRAVLRLLRLRVPGPAVPAARPRREPAGLGPQRGPDGAGDDAGSAGGRSPAGRPGRRDAGLPARPAADHHRTARAVPARHRLVVLAAAVGLLPLGAGMGLAMTPATAAITDALPAAKQGVGSATNDLARELGGALGIAVLGSLLQSSYRSGLDVSGMSAQTAEQARSSLALASRLGPSVAQDAQAAFTDGLQFALTCAAGAVALGAVVVVALLHRTDDRHGEPAAGREKVEVGSAT